MNKRNVWNEPTADLEVHEDERGKIADVFYKRKIDHVSIITSKAGAVRGNHYHKNSIQHTLLIRGAIEYWHKLFDSDKSAEVIKLVPGDLVTSPPMEIHTLKATEDSEFISFSEGIRGGKDYESDTVRVSSIINSGKK